MHCECKALLGHFTFDNRHLGVSKLIIYTVHRDADEDDSVSVQ